jgi:hypothetical protein
LAPAHKFGAKDDLHISLTRNLIERIAEILRLHRNRDELRLLR